MMVTIILFPPKIFTYSRATEIYTSASLKSYNCAGRVLNNDNIVVRIETSYILSNFKPKMVL